MRVCWAAGRNRTVGEAAAGVWKIKLGYNNKGMPNSWKFCVLSEVELGERVLSISGTEVREFWKSKTLREMETIMTLHDKQTLSYFFDTYLYPFLQSKKCLDSEAYVAACFSPAVHRALNEHNDHPPKNVHQAKNDRGEEEMELTELLRVYDLKMFRSMGYEKSLNDLLSAFLMIRPGSKPITEEIHEIIDNQILHPEQWCLKVKESALLRVYSQLEKENCFNSYKSDKTGEVQEVAIMPSSKYYSFLYSWMTSIPEPFLLEDKLKRYFLGIVKLIENQVYAAMYADMGEKEKHMRRFQRPMKILPKPAQKEGFTMIQQKYPEIVWQSLKVFAFELKYEVREEAETFMCFRARRDPKILEPFMVMEEELETSEEDQVILEAFGLKREEELKKNYGYCYR